MAMSFGVAAAVGSSSSGVAFSTTAVTRETWTVQSPCTRGMAGFTSRMIRPACSLTGLL
ncbi:hypothetical protein D3C85_1826110 [compost metagenome]